MHIGERIKKRRIELGMSADELGALINKSRATIYRYENGDVENMPTTVLEPLAEALKTTPAELMGWNPEEDKMLKRMRMYYELFRSLSDVGQEMAIANMELIKKVHPREEES